MKFLVGKGRVFKCLQENLAQPDFGSACKAEVEERSLSMQQNYQLDFGVSNACEPDVQDMCQAEKVGCESQNLKICMKSQANQHF